MREARIGIPRSLSRLPSLEAVVLIKAWSRARIAAAIWWEEDMACKGHGLETRTTAVADDDFESFSEARTALLKELMAQVKQDRKGQNENCDRFDDCEQGKRCATTIRYRLNQIDRAIYSYDDDDGDLAYGYEWEGGNITSACRCVRKKRKKKAK